MENTEKRPRRITEIEAFGSFSEKKNIEYHKEWIIFLYFHTIYGNKKILKPIYMQQ